ncbi:MAG: hypothetical protein IKS31_01150 [Clostridia bacterium]|nr:hypothetical protein [Clostridia bacterium]
MGLFFPDEKEPDLPFRKVGFARYRQILEANYKCFFLVDFITLVFFIPFAAGALWAVLTGSALIMLAAGIVGGAIAGPALAGMYDIILRRLRNDKGDWWVRWTKAMRQNWRGAILPGIAQCVPLGMAVFVGAMMLRRQLPFSWGTVALLLFGCLLMTMIVTVWWVQEVLFVQRLGIKLKNALFFSIKHLGKAAGAALIRVVWWLVIVLLLPWTAFVVPFLGVWYVLFLSVFILYRDLDEDFRIEEQILEKFPETIAEDED